MDPFPQKAEQWLPGDGRGGVGGMAGWNRAGGGVFGEHYTCSLSACRHGRMGVYVCYIYGGKFDCQLHPDRAVRYIGS